VIYRYVQCIVLLEDTGTLVHRKETTLTTKRCATDIIVETPRKDAACVRNIPPHTVIAVLFVVLVDGEAVVRRYDTTGVGRVRRGLIGFHHHTDHGFYSLRTLPCCML
jgi:hypothetical protein